MKAFVYIRFDCPACERLVSEINKNDLDANVINVQEYDDIKQNIQVFPSLYVNGRLKAFGDDILNFLLK